MAELLEQDMTGTLSRYVSEVTLADVPEDVVLQAKRLLLDTLGCIIAATRTSMAPICYASAAFLGNGSEATIAGLNKRSSIGAALYANARLGNCMDLDETYPVGQHFGIGAVVAGLALAEAKGLSGQDLLLALIAGYELGGRLSEAAGPPMYIADGRVTGYPELYGFSASVVFAAAGAAIKLLKLDPNAARNTFGIAGAYTPVPVMSQWSQAVDLPDCKYAEAGWCTLAGVLAAETARLGASGFSSILDGDRGLIRMSGTKSFEPDMLVGELGRRWMLSDMTYKPWPTCGWTHWPMTAFAKAIKRRPVDWREIISVRLETNRLLCTPRFRNPSPKSFCSHQFSIPHGVAMMLLDVPVGPAWLDPVFDDDERVRSLRQKVEVAHFDEGDRFAEHIVRGQTRIMPARATIQLQNETIVAETDYALGNPWDPETAFDDTDIQAKFRTASGLDDSDADRLIEAIYGLERLPDVAVLIDGVAKPNIKRT